jgi:hypothetical protein
LDLQTLNQHASSFLRDFTVDGWWSDLEWIADAWFINHFCMVHKPKTMSELYFMDGQRVGATFLEAEAVGVGDTIPTEVAPSIAHRFC